jgi:hypothetical protein
VARFVETLRHHHGFLHAEAKTRAGGLLQRGGDKRRAQLAWSAYLHAPARCSWLSQARTAAMVSSRFTGRNGLSPLCVTCSGNASPPGVVVLASTSQYSSGTNALISRSRSTTRRTATDWTRPADRPRAIFPQQWRDHVAHHAIHKTARLLSVDTVNIQFARLFESLTNRILGDLVEHHAAIALFITADNFPQVPCDGFPFAVKVGCEIDVVSFSANCLSSETTFSLPGSIS